MNALPCPDADPRSPLYTVDWWPFTRLLISATTLGLAAHVFLGWEVQPRQLLALSGQMLGVLSILAMISFTLADLYLLLFLGPLYVVGVLNDWFYGASRWICRTVLRLQSTPLLALGGLCGEILLFGSLICLIRGLIQ